MKTSCMRKNYVDTRGAFIESGNTSFLWKFYRQLGTKLKHKIKEN